MPVRVPDVQVFCETRRHSIPLREKFPASATCFGTPLQPTDGCTQFRAHEPCRLLQLSGDLRGPEPHPHAFREPPATPYVPQTPEIQIALRSRGLPKGLPVDGNDRSRKPAQRSAFLLLPQSCAFGTRVSPRKVGFVF